MLKKKKHQELAIFWEVIVVFKLLLRSEATDKMACANYMHIYLVFLIHIPTIVIKIFFYPPNTL
jgi:hypothetical protein